jgi:hypothetical protein
VLSAEDKALVKSQAARPPLQQQVASGQLQLIDAALTGLDHHETSSRQSNSREIDLYQGTCRESCLDFYCGPWIAHPRYFARYIGFGRGLDAR